MDTSCRRWRSPDVLRFEAIGSRHFRDTSPFRAKRIMIASLSPAPLGEWAPVSKAIG